MIKKGRDMFEDAIQIDLDIKIGKEKFEIPGGNIRNLNLNLFSYGFNGSIGFWIISDSVKDTLFLNFLKPDLIELTLTVEAVYNQSGEKTSPLTIKSIVTGKSVREETYNEVSDKPVLQRYYEMSFRDAPSLLWSQHYPSKIYVEKKMSDIIKEHTVSGITTDLDFKALEKKCPMQFLGLGNEENDASFYDFLMWYLKSNNGLCYYDYKKYKFCLTDKKPVEKEAYSIKRYETKDLSLSLKFPETIRHNNRILNASTESSKTIDVKQDQAVTGLNRDMVIREDIAGKVSTIQTLEKSKLKVRDHELKIDFGQFPSYPFWPGSFIEFGKEYWGSDSYIYKKKYRVYEVSITAEATQQKPGENYNAPFNTYKSVVSAKLEHSDNPVAFFPEFKTPKYPVYIEGRIISEAGKKEDKTFQIETDKETSEESYAVHVPLWNCKVMAPFTPGITTGHFFFPAFTNSRVLLAVYYDCAEIDKFLDWGDGTRLTMDSQGNHILFGKNDASNMSMKYEYAENKPKFIMKRISDKDTELIQMEDGNIILQTKEEKK